MFYNDKDLDVGAICGRFQHIHIGHEAMINTGLKVCGRILILVGSAQEIATERNPFDVHRRIELIKSVYPHDNVVVKPLNDLTNENDITSDWGRYLLQNMKRVMYKNPEVMIYGNDSSRSKWFDVEDIKDITEVIVNRNKINISATQLREYLLLDDKENWHKYTNPRIHKYYDSLRAELLTVPYYKDKYNTILKVK